MGVPCQPETPCPITALHLATYDTSTQQLSVSQEAKYRLPMIKGPLYVLSEIGAFNTGKSARLTVSCRLLLPKKLRDKCNSGFIVRNADVDPTLVHTGKTRGVWMLSVRVSSIIEDDISSDILRNAVRRLDPGGTIIFLDSEGGEELGKDSANINLMQLLVVQLSSHVNMAVRERLEPATFSHLSMLAHLVRLYNVFEQGRQSCKDKNRPSEIAVSCPEFAVISMKGSELLPFFPDIKSENGQVIRVPSVFSLDASKVLHGELQKASDQPHTRSAANLVQKYMSTLTYWGTLPATWTEMNFFKTMEVTPGLPSADVGFVLGWSAFNLPAILNRVTPKVMQNEIMDGNKVLNFIQQFIQITNKINVEWLRSEDTKSLSTGICQHVLANVRSMLDNAEPLLNEKLPIETSPVCANSKEKCPNEEFEKEWSKISQNVTETTCFMKNLMTEEGWVDCRRTFEPEVSKLHDKLLRRNQELCGYNWTTGDWSSTCDGSCPGYFLRDRMCTNKRYEMRPSRCCEGGVEPEVKQSCERWSYKWIWDGWTQCSSSACGSQTRSVSCLKCDGTVVGDEMCHMNAPEKPPTSQTCNVHYAFAVAEWNPSSCPCGHNQIRDVWCQSNCGSKVSPDLCEGKAPVNTNYCGDCPSSGGGGGCFGSQNFAHTEGGAKKSLAALRPGSVISSASFSGSAGPTVASDEVIFLMTAQKNLSNFVTIRTAANSTITLTSDHLLPVQSSSEDPELEMLPAGEIKIDRHFLLTRDERTGELRWSRVSHVRAGVIDFPVVLLTMRDFAVVSNVVASCHTGSELVGKAITLPLKMAFKLFGPSALDSDIARATVKLYDELIGY